MTPWDDIVRIDTLAATFTLDLGPFTEEWIAISSGTLLGHSPDLDGLMEFAERFGGFVEYHYVSRSVLECGRGKCLPLS